MFQGASPGKCVCLILGHSENAAALVQGRVDLAHAGRRTWYHPCSVLCQMSE